MSAHDDFLEGFGDALGLSDSEEILAHYQKWIQLEGLNEVELIDLEIGYQTGLEVGQHYKETRLDKNDR
jgi:hypothetical protein